MENYGLCGYVPAVVRSEQHFSVCTGLAGEAVQVYLHLPLGGSAASALTILLLPAVSLLCHQLESEMTLLTPFTVVYWRGCLGC